MQFNLLRLQSYNFFLNCARKLTFFSRKIKNANYTYHSCLQRKAAPAQANAASLLKPYRQSQPKPTLPLFYSPIWGANQWERLKCADKLTFFFRKI